MNNVIQIIIFLKTDTKKAEHCCTASDKFIVLFLLEIECERYHSCGEFTE